MKNRTALLIKLNLILGLIFCGESLSAAAERPVTISFEHPFVSDPPCEVQYTESTFQFQLLESVWRDLLGLPYCVVRNSGVPSFHPANGTLYLLLFGAESLEFFSADGSSFDLISADLAEYSTVFAFPVTIYVTGFKANGQVVIREITTDGIMDGAGPLADFQTVAFGPKFKHLVRVVVVGGLAGPGFPTDDWTHGFALDNVVVRKHRSRSSGR